MLLISSNTYYMYSFWTISLQFISSYFICEINSSRSHEKNLKHVPDRMAWFFSSLLDLKFIDMISIKYNNQKINW